MLSKVRRRFRETRCRLVDWDRHLVYVHVGKCGGRSLERAIKRSPTVRQQFRLVSRVHGPQPPIHARSRYLIVLRNPVARTLSAFNWRYKLVVVDGKRPGWPGEREALAKYETLNALAEALYRDGELVAEVAADFATIGHFGKNITYYLSDLTAGIRPDQVYGVVVTERMEADAQRLLGVDSLERVHENSTTVSEAQRHLSETARENLRRILAPDYDTIRAVDRLRPLDDDARDILLA